MQLSPSRHSAQLNATIAGSLLGWAAVKIVEVSPGQYLAVGVPSNWDESVKAVNARMPDGFTIGIPPGEKEFKLICLQSEDEVQRFRESGGQLHYTNCWFVPLYSEDMGASRCLLDAMARVGLTIHINIGAREDKASYQAIIKANGDTLGQGIAPTLEKAIAIAASWTAAKARIPAGATG